MLFKALVSITTLFFLWIEWDVVSSDAYSNGEKLASLAVYIVIQTLLMVALFTL